VLLLAVPGISNIISVDYFNSIFLFFIRLIIKSMKKTLLTIFLAVLAIITSKAQDFKFGTFTVEELGMKTTTRILPRMR
jgi:hypothetical protein